MKTVSIRRPDDDVETLAELEAKTGADRAEILRRLVRHGLANWKRDRALEKLQNHEISLHDAAERADVSYVEMYKLASDGGIDVGYTMDDLERDLETI